MNKEQHLNTSVYEDDMTNVSDELMAAIMSRDVTNVCKSARFLRFRVPESEITSITKQQQLKQHG